MLANVLIVVGALIVVVGLVGLLLELRRSWRARAAGKSGPPAK
jgi:hypothetical protein